MHTYETTEAVRMGALTKQSSKYILKYDTISFFKKMRHREIRHLITEFIICVIPSA